MSNFTNENATMFQHQPKTAVALKIFHDIVKDHYWNVEATNGDEDDATEMFARIEMLLKKSRDQFVSLHECLSILREIMDDDEYEWRLTSSDGKIENSELMYARIRTALGDTAV